MQTVVLQSDSKTDLKLMIDLAKKIGIEVKVIKEEQSDLLTEIETGLIQVKKMRNGELPKKTLSQIWPDVGLHLSCVFSLLPPIKISATPQL